MELLEALKGAGVDDRTLAAVLIAAGGYLGATYGTLLNFDSPSQAMTTVWLLALSFVLLEYLAGAFGGSALWLIGALGVACVGGKASAAIVAIGATGVVVVVAFLRGDQFGKRALGAFITMNVPGAITYFLVLVGSASSGDLRLGTWEFRASTVQGLELVTRDHEGERSMGFRTLFLQEMARGGVIMPALVASLAHGPEELAMTLEALTPTLKIYAEALASGVGGFLEGPEVKPVFRRMN